MTQQKVGVEIEWHGAGVKEKSYCKKTGKLLVNVDLQFFRPAEV